MAFIHAIHLVLFGLLVLANLLLIPIVAMGGYTIGVTFSLLLTQDPDLLAVLPVVTAFMAVGFVNGSVALVIMHNPPPQAGGVRAGGSSRASRGGAKPAATDGARKKSSPAKKTSTKKSAGRS